MKKILIASIIVGLALSSCLFKDEQGDPVIGVFAPPSLAIPGNEITLIEENADQELNPFTWTDADFGFQSATTYTLQVDEVGNEFANAFDLAITSEKEAKFTVGEFNNKLLTFGLPGDWTSEIEFRVMATVNENVQSLYSGIAPMTVTTYDVVVDYPKLYVPGSYQGWDPANEKTVVYSVKSNDKYQGYLNFTEETTEFKFTRVMAWEQDQTIGDPDAGGQSGTLQDGDWGGNNIKVTTGAGYYLVKADLNALTYSTTKTHWGLIGSATPNGWDADQDMTYDAVNGVWTITVDLVPGEIKFRANDDWALNYGDTGPDGKLEEGGDNIAVGEAGNYTITLNLEVPLYTYSIVKN